MENTTTPATATPSSVAIRYGLIVGLISTIISFALSMAELDQTPAKWLTTIVLLVGIWMAHTNFKQQNSGFMTYGQGITIGTLLSLVVAIISLIYTYVYVNFLDTNFAARILDKTRADMEARGNMSDAQIEQAMSWTAKFVDGPLMLAFVVIFVVLTGFLASLLISAITKNPRPEFE
ncbi:DUF4199 domain-containing protein [Microvirga sp. STR05]|uniref:DUF4199 domain-containing protein n=1 Tax=Hymenobacter duratus TaxID=2771356 RepID=A0ABR8JI74_9BACT|nr:DUF4199 domain-containing protein [Hymenobacter duratus]MBD2716557.1 DUF4199 domain-containing protein [Hymenobacter duratus]MBR7951472.1 DUF4199 domain-containing protein [Microvirga sp. STR05]